MVQHCSLLGKNHVRIHKLENLRQSLLFLTIYVTLCTLYTVRRFNSRNGPVKAKFAYLCTSGCCRLRNTLLVKLCIS